MTNVTLTSPGPLRDAAYRIAGLWTIAARDMADRELLEELTPR